MHSQSYDYSSDKLSAVDINDRCEAYILRFYSYGKQLTFDRTGTDDEKNKMYDFIDRCRKWSNSVKPSLFDLYQIKP
ncbi:hypothetical protein [Zooshikella sp. RANM57]|uniref:hypothetical protein n=1 Tax=Zooshikella sp. RANM57 TaxID=3425863 RepID=UPI003D6FBCD3